MIAIILIIGAFVICCSVISYALRLLGVPSFQVGGATGCLPIIGVTISVGLSILIILLLFYLNNINKSRAIEDWSQKNKVIVIDKKRANRGTWRDGSIVRLFSGHDWVVTVIPGNKRITLSYGNIWLGDLDWEVASSNSIE
jgi:hypothetical protein